MKKLLLIPILLVFLCACAGAQSEPSVPAETPEATVEAATPVSGDDDPIVVAPTPVPATPPPVPTPTPEPTPEPTPTPVPVSETALSEKQRNLLLDETIETVYTHGLRQYLLRRADAKAERFMPFKPMDGIYHYEWILLGKTDDGAYCHVRAIGADAEGYLESRSVKETQLTAPESPYAILVRPHGILYSMRDIDSAIAAHANYEPVRVLGVDERFAAVLTPEGETGYVQLGQIQFVSRETFDTYLRQSCETPENTFSREALVSDAETFVGVKYTDAASLLFDLLRSEGLHFNEAYYRFYQKPLDNETLYPKKLYIAPVYNSLAFKLFNSAGDLVTLDGSETEWAYIDSYDALEPGDLVFFSDMAGKGNAIVPDVEVVIHGRFSGDVTGCGLYLGDGRMLTVENGAGEIVEIDETAANAFECGRRIFPSVTDEKAHLIEVVISMVYDRLGTPYSNGKRIGDASYDCSGILNWAFRSLGYRRGFRNELSLDMTASEFGGIETLVSETRRITFVDPGIPRRDHEALKTHQRGDIIVLLNEKRNKVGHVMLYLGDNTVIHSTTVDAKYRGTLVAKFRTHLQYLYAGTRRIESITPIS